MHKVRIMVYVKIKVALGLIAILILAAPIAIAQEVPPHVVISAVYPKVNNTHSEWIELYNPTAENVDIGGWTIDTSNDLADATIPDVMIPAHGFYLIADEGFSTEKDDPSWPDADLEELITLTDAHGWCRLNNSVSFVDTVGWGTATTNETLNAGKPAKGESIERKSLDVDYAPCQDTDNNFVDFFKQETPTPKNRSSPEMDPAPVELFDLAGNFKGGFVNIQDAVDAASDKDTIRVDNGTYNENLDVAKQLTICSEHGAAFTTVQASDPDDNVFDVTVDHVAISGFNVVGATQQAGIYLCNANYCNISNNSASNNKIGIRLSSSNDNLIYNNYFENANNAEDDKNNIWNITKIDGTNIIGGPSLGGNYWSDYVGADTDDDGLGDLLLPYNSNGNLANGGDRHPLVPVGSAPSLSIEKSDELDPVQPGGTLNYTIIVENTGNATATNVNVTETYDANVTYKSAVPAPSPGNNTWIYPMLNVSETRWLNISVTVNPSTPIGTVLHNIVNVTCDEGVTDTDTADTTVSCGEVVQLTGLQTADIVWNKSNFGGFCYDLGDNACIGTETLTIAAGTLEGPNIDRNIEETALTYTTSTIPREYELHKNTGLTVDGDSNYSIGFWMGKRYVAIAGKANKLAKPLVEFDSTDKKTIATGEVWQLGGGFSLVANQIDLERDKVWFYLYKNGMELDNVVISTSGNCSDPDRVYTYTEDAAGETDIPIFSCYGDAVFRGTDSNMVQVMYVFLIDNEEIREINVGDEYDNMTVVTVNPSDIVLKNHLEIDLLPSTTALIMGNLFFKTTENTSAIEFYPCLVGEGEPQTPKITSFAPPSPVNDTVCNWRTFNVYVDQTVNVRWYLNNTLQHTNVSTKEASYTLHAEVVGEHNVSAIASNENGTDMQTWVWNVTVAPALPPNITSFAPPSPVNDTVCNWRTFNVTVDQTVNVSWYLNNTLQHTNVSTKEANYTLHAEVVGEHNVSAIASNENGTDMQTWVWNVTVAPEPVLEINKTGVPDPVSPGGALDYTIRMNNAGNATAINVIVKETYDTNVTFIAAEPAPSSGDDTWQFATLNASETRWINISLIVNASALNGTVLHNIVNVTCDEGVTDTDTADTTILFKELNCTCGDICVNTTGWWRDGGAFNTSGTPIQAAIDNATAGDVICVKDGTYTENVDVYKRLTIRSENGAASTSVLAARDGYVFEVTADYVNISGFHVTSETKLTSGIYLYGANYCNISDNIANDNSDHGIFLNSSSDNTLVNNTANSNNESGIYLYQDSNNNYLINNTASENKGDGFKLESNSNHNSIIGNIASDNDKNGIRLYGTSGNPSSHNTVANNTADLNAKSGIIIEGADSDYNTIVNNTCKSNDYGMSIRYGDYNNLTKNTCNQNTEYGIRLYQSADNNEITNNTVISNTKYGIYISSSDYNILYNNYFNNTNNACDNSDNVWNTTKTLGTNIIGGPYLGGNYWSDYAGRDINGDGLGDTLLPYNSSRGITNGGDYHPLVPVGYAPVLSIVKLDKPDPVSPAGTLNYTICVNNTGNATATNVTVTETYDGNVTFVTAVPAPSSGDDTWQFPTLNVSETRWINISVIVNASVLNRTVLYNIVNVSCAEGVTGSGTEATTVSAGYAPPEITYFAPRSPVNDTVDAWRTFNVTVNQTVDIEWYIDNSYQDTNNSVREASFKLQAEVGEHIVTANASNGNGSDSHSWVWNVKQPGISITKVSSVTEGVPSSNVNFTINVTNTGDCTLNPVKVVDTLPAGMSYVAIGTSPAPTNVQGNTLTWNIVDPLNPGDSSMISLIAHIDTSAEGTLTNLVNATGKPPAGDNVTDSDTANVTVFEPDIVVISEVFYDESGTDNNEFCVLYNPTDSDIDIGDWTLNAFDQTGALKTTTTFPDDASITANMFYLIGEKNPLNSGDWGGTAISPDCLRGGTDDWQNGPDDYLVLEDSGGNYIDGVRWGHKDGNNPPPIPDVPDNNTAPDAAKGKSIERKPLGGGYAPCQDTDDNSVDFVVQDTPTPKNSSSRETGISVTKVGNVTDAAPSTLVKFNITVTNTGNCTLTHVLVEDTLPQGMTYSSSDPLANSTNGAIIWDDVGPLAANLSKTIELVAKIAEDATGVLNNTVNVTGTPENATNVSASATAQVRVIRLGIEKSCSSSTVSLGGTVTYTIEYSNPGGTNLTNVVITENYPDGLTFISAVPAPDSGTNNTWTIGTLPAGESGKITIKMKVPDSMSDLSYEESGSVSGEGIVMISKELSTMVEPYKLENIVTISGSYGATNVSATDSAITTVMSGSSLEITEHGSGTYESEEELSLSSKSGGISFDKTTNAKYQPTTFKCSDGFVMEVPSKWSQDICIKNYAKEIAIHKTITEATTLEDDTRINTDNKGYTMKFDSTFLGYLHVDKKTKDAATSEHYIGEFVITSWDQRGKGMVDGVGYVIVDKVLSSGRLLLMEHGSGYYWSEEDSSSSTIKKITDAKYEPTSFNFSDGFVVNFSSKWMQDVCARSGTGTSALHKKIRDASYIDDDTTAKSTPALIFHTFFYGATHVGSKSRYSRASEDYIGDFYISWGASSTFIFDWDDVPGSDNDDLIDHLSEPRFNMSWVTDDDVKITKSTKKDTIKISTPEHSAEIILDTKTNETAELIVDGVDTYSFNVVKHGNALRVYDPEFERKPEVVSGEGFVMVDEAIFQDGKIEVTEHGSGTYYSEEAFGSKTIEKYTYGVYKPTYFSFSDSFAVNFSSLWMQDICAKDKKEGTAIHKKISDAALMKDDTIAAKSLMNITSSFNGSMHIGARTENISISEDYIGEFNVTERIKIVKEKPPKSSSESSDWLSCPCPIPSSIYQWFCQDPTYRGRWLSVCPYPYADAWLYIHP